MTEGSDIMKVEQFTIQDVSEADSYLTDLLEKPEYQSMDEVELRAAQYIKDASIRDYFIGKAREMLNA